MFQVMPPRGGIVKSLLIKCNLHSFKSCPREGASNTAIYCFCSWHVSSHAPARGHLQIIVNQRLIEKFQVMPPRGGIICPPLRRWRPPVSSHAPARGHLGLSEICGNFCQVSSHAPARGHLACQRGRIHQPLLVSSHAPARGHQKWWGCFWLLESCFKSCPREGASRCHECLHDGIEFQVMPPRGGIAACRRV